MTKRKNKKKNIFKFILILILLFASYNGLKYLDGILNSKEETQETEKGKKEVKNKEEKEDNIKKETQEVKTNEGDFLKALGYSKDDIKIIRNKMKEDEINKIESYDKNLIKYLKVDYFHIENIKRYTELLNKSDYSIEEVIMRVNTGIDKDYYTNIKTVSDPDDLLVIVNKYNALPSNYVPKDLISVGNGQKMQKEAGEALIKMLEDINNEGLYLKAQSGYRSIDTQKYLYDSKVKTRGVEATDAVQARPGHSEHHTGLAIDVSIDGTLEKTFENTKQFEWLDKHANEYGFILRYPSDKIYMTGYDYEPWHYRYVGKEAAQKIKKEGITFEEYCVKYLGLY